MADIKLFRVGHTAADVMELQGTSAGLEKSLQTLIEKNLDALLGVRFLASEFMTSKSYGGRIDTLGIDEDGSPVIIEYKRALNENVINQGLFYLDWLLDHKADFKLLVMERLGDEAASNMDWTSPRLLCIAGDFSRYDEHAVQQINRNIELIRYRRFGDELLLFELVNASVGTPLTDDGTGGGARRAPKGVVYKTAVRALGDAEQHVKDLFELMKAFLMSLGDDVQFKQLRPYFAFKRFKNFATVEFHSKLFRVFVKVPPDSVILENGFTRDVTNIGHWGTGNLEITIEKAEQLEKAKPLLLKSYEVS
jgi:predicted transport protein